MSLIIVIGLKGPMRSDEAFPVYVGHSGEAARQACLASSARRLLTLRNPVGINKNNPHCEANTARLLNEAAAANELAAAAELARANELAALRSQVSDLESALATSKTSSDAQARSIANLTAELEAAKQEAATQSRYAGELFDEIQRMKREAAAQAQPTESPASKPGKKPRAE